MSLDRFRLDDRVALVTGASRGLGFAMAEALASAGATVVVTSRVKATADAAAARIPKAAGLALDVTDERSVSGGIAEVVARFGRLDILVNNAGTTRRGPIEALTAADFAAVIDTNLKGAWLCSRAVAPVMRAARGGCILNVSSMFDGVALPDRTPYIASKGGVSALTRALAVELAAAGIRVNAISPGPFATSMHDEASRAGMLANIPLGRWGDPAELGPAVVFLVSDASSFVTGATLTIDGGYSAR